MSGLVITSLSVDLGGRRIVRDVSFAAQPGELVGLIGANGVGKSTFLRAAAGLIEAASGTVFWNGMATRTMPSTQQARSIAFLPQGQSIHWDLSVRHLIALGRLPHLGLLSRLTTADNSAIERAMIRADVLHLAEKSTLELSGGERSRVLLARALAVEAPVLLADEPTAALDPFHQLRTLSLLRDLAAEGGLVLTVLHDLSLAARFCNRILLMHEGSIIADGPPRDVLTESNLEMSYRVQAYRAEYDKQLVLLPWMQLAAFEPAKRA